MTGRSKAARLAAGILLASALAAPAWAVWQKFLGDISVTSMLSSGNVAVQGVLSAARASFTSELNVSSVTFSGISTPSSATARTVYFDNTLDRLAYTTKTGQILTVDPAYIFAMNWDRRNAAIGSAGDTVWMGFSAFLSTQAWATTEAPILIPFGSNGVMKQLNCRMCNNSSNVTFTVRRSGSDMPMACTVTAAVTVGNCVSSGTAAGFVVSSTDTITVRTTNNPTFCAAGFSGCTLVLAPGVN